MLEISFDWSARRRCHTAAAQPLLILFTWKKNHKPEFAITKLCSAFTTLWLNKTHATHTRGFCKAGGGDAYPHTVE